MPRADRDGRRRLGALVFCAGLFPFLGACRSVTLAPTDASWIVTGAGKDARAVWRAGSVEVSVPVELRGDATIVHGTIANSGPAAFNVTFSAPLARDVRTWVGDVSGGTGEGGRWSSPIVPGNPVEVPAGSPGAPGTVEFGVRPDRPWTADETPAPDSTITWDIAVTGQSADATCPLHFRVAASSSAWTSRENQAIIVALLAFAGLVAWAW